MSQDTGGTKTLTTVKCEKHGLRYNPHIHAGCVRCRKEAGEQIGQAPPAASGAVPVVPGSVAAPSAGSVIPALLVTAILVVGTGFLFYVVHQMVYETAAPTLGFDPELGIPIEDAEEAEDEVPFFEEEAEPPRRSRPAGGELSDEDEKVRGGR